MTSRPLRSVAADSNVLLSAVAGRAARRVFEKAPDLVVVTTELVIAEVHKYVPKFAERYGFEVDFLHEMVEVLPLERYSESGYITHVQAAKKYLERRDPGDVHLAALALKLDVPVWSNDRDLTELPLRIYTTAQTARGTRHLKPLQPFLSSLPFSRGFGNDLELHVVNDDAANVTGTLRPPRKIKRFSLCSSGLSRIMPP